MQQDRRTARATQVAVDPVTAARRKMVKNVAKKESRKRKNGEWRDKEGRGKVKRRREE